VFAEGDLAQRSSPTPTIAIRVKAPCDRNDIGWLVLRRGGLGARRIALSVSDRCWFLAIRPRPFSPFSTGVFRATAANMGQNELQAGNNLILPKAMQNERRG